MIWPNMSSHVSQLQLLAIYSVVTFSVRYWIGGDMDCTQCGRRIVARLNGRIVAPKADHDLCQRCYDSEVERARAARLAVEES